MRHYLLSFVLSLTILLLTTCGPSSPPSFGKAGGPPPLDPATAASTRSLGAATVPMLLPRHAPPLPLKVIHRSPARAAEGLSAVLVTFNQPMTRLGRSRVIENAAAWPMTVQPPVRGAVRWVAGDTAKLALTRPLQNARRYTVTVPTSVKSISGSALAAPLSWTFETPRPRLVRVMLRPAEARRYSRLLPGDSFEVLFNLHVDPTAAGRSVTLLVNGGRWPFSTSRPTGKHAKDLKRVLVRPSRLLPVSAKVTLRVQEGLSSTEGPLTSAKVASRSFQMYGPLKARVLCDGTSVTKSTLCWPMSNDYHGGLSLEFTEPVCGRELLRGLRLTPGKRLLTRHLRTRWPNGVSTPATRNTCAKNWSLAHDLALRQAHRVTLNADMRDVFGQRLGAAARDLRFTTRGLPPDIFMPRDGPGLREPWHPYAVKTVNVKQLQVRITPFRGKELVALLECLRRSSSETCTRWASGTFQPVKMPGKRDRVERTVVKLPGALSAITLRSPQVRGEDKEMVSFTRLAAHASLGVHARLSAYGVTAWVTRLGDGQGIKGAVVEVYHGSTAKLLATARTGAAGLVELPRKVIGPLLDLEKPPRLYVLARLGGEEVYVALDVDATWRSHRYWDPDPAEIPRLASYAAWEGDRPFLAGYISTERGIYRPGHTVHVHGAVRRYVSFLPGPLAGATVRVELQGEGRQVIARKTVRLSPLGVFSLSLPLPAKGRLGHYAVALNVGDAHVAMHSFRVAEYREPRFAVKLSAPDHIRAPQKLTIDAAARLFFGGKMGGAAYRLSVSREHWNIYVPGKDGYLAGASPWDYYHRERRWRLLDGTLDAAGALRKTLDPRDATGGAHDPWPCQHKVELEVSSASRRTSAARAWIYQLPGDRYAAYKRLPARGKVIRRHVMVFEPSRPAPPGARGNTVPYVTARAGRVRATLYAVPRGKRIPDWSAELWKKTLAVSTRGAVLEVPWKPAYAAFKEVVLVLSVTDASGREARTALSLRAPTPWENDWDRRQAASERKEKRRRAELKLTLDRQRYLPGQTATLTVRRRGWSGDAVLFVERERLYSHQRLRFDKKGVATVKLPVLERYLRRVNLRVVGLRKGKALRGKTGPLVSASAELVVSTRPFTLHVGLSTDRKVYRPGQKVDVKVHVVDGLKRGRRSQVVIMAVDEAVLRLTNYRLPDPYYSLARYPSDGILAEDIRAHLLSLKIPIHPCDHTKGCGIGGTGLGTIGAGGGGGGTGYGHGHGRMSSRKKRARRRFLTTAWHATLVTDAHGRAAASFTLPDNLTQYRLMAFAVDRKRSAGKGSAEFRVDLPLLSLSALPRLLRVGDTAQAGVVLYNTALPPGKATVTARVTGKAVTLLRSKTAVVHLPRGASREVRFPLAARQQGTARLTFSVSMGKVNDTVEQQLRVTRPTVMEASSVSGQTRGVVSQGIEPLRGLRPDVGGLEVRLASTALTGVEDGMDQLVRYPYGCLEQQSSRLLPLLAAVVLQRRFSLELPGDPRELIGHGLANVLAMQRSDGGFGYWPSSSVSWPWATAYALVVLHRARMAQKVTGIAVPADAVARAVKYLEPHARVPEKLGRYWFAHQSFILYALALNDRKIHKSAEKMFAQRQQKPLFARAMLLSALANQEANKAGTPAHKRMLRVLTAELSDSLRVDGTWAHAEENLHDGYKVLMHSDDRTTAMVLLALLQADPAHPMIPRLVRWFLLGRKQARFRNTQEAAWALLAFWDYARILEKQVPDFEAGVWLGQRRLISTRFAGHSVKPVLTRLQMAHLMEGAGTARRLVIAKRGKGTLYYVARLRYAPRALPSKAKDHGFSVERRVTVLDRGGRSLSRAPRLGDTVLITLKVHSTEARRYVVVEDPMPAGLEALDATLSTGSRSFGAWSAWSDSSYWDHRELRDDRVLFFRDHMQPGKLTYRYLARVTTPGEFVKPPARAEEMYTPEVYGYTAAARVTFAK